MIEIDSFGILYKGYLLSIVNFKREREEKERKERGKRKRDQNIIIKDKNKKSVT